MTGRNLWNWPGVFSVRESRGRLWWTTAACLIPVPVCFRRRTRSKPIFACACRGWTACPPASALEPLNLATGGSTLPGCFSGFGRSWGWLYSVDSGTCAYLSGGLFEIQTAVNPEMAETAVEEILKTLEELKKGVTFTEFSRAREQLEGRPGYGDGERVFPGRAYGPGELLKGPGAFRDELLEMIGGVTMEEVNDMANQIFNLNQLSVSVVGPKLNPSFTKQSGEYHESERIVVKVGNLHIDLRQRRLNIRRIDHLCKVLSDLQNSGREIILVSSGAIGGEWESWG